MSSTLHIQEEHQRTLSFI